MRFRMKVPLLFRVFGSGFGVASPRRSTRQVRIDLIATGSDFERKMTQRPAMIIAFDTSFDAQDAQVCRMREPSDLNGSLIPIIYPMIINSAEHVDICISKRIPSAQRFQMVVQTTFRACDGLGGRPPPGNLLSSMSENPIVALKKSLAERFRSMAEAVAVAAMSENFHSNLVIPPALLELEPLSDASFESQYSEVNGTSIWSWHAVSTEVSWPTLL
jgi:hypothetical protein